MCILCILGIAQSGNIEALRECIKNGSNIESKNKHGDTPLHIASSYGHVELVHELIMAGANLEVRNNSEETPLHLAYFTGKVKVVNELLNHGASVYSKDVYGVLPHEMESFDVFDV